MRLQFIEVCGFRGFRDLVRINFGRGFTVITGRNGVGKSTLCDAVEFAITGSIDKYAVEKAAKESLSDYLWWRGEGVPKAHYVTVSFVDDSGNPFTITRTRERGSDRSPEEIHAALCRGVRRQKFWDSRAADLVEGWPRLGLRFRRRFCGAASADVRGSGA